QQVASWPVGTAAPSGVKVPFEPIEKEARAFEPASATIRCPAESKSTANGTASGSELTTGVLAGAPLPATAKTSTALVLLFVVTTSFDPSGVKATWPGVWVNSGVAFGSRPSGRFQPLT